MRLQKTIRVIIAGSGFLFLMACSSPLVYSSLWQSKPVTVDGKAGEWRIPLDFYDDKTKLNFTITNDKTNLYICIRATEDETQKGIIHSGLQIWIDTTGGKKSQVGVQFPILERSASTESPADSKHTHSSESSMMEPTSSANSLKSRYMSSGKQLKLTGFINAANGLDQIPNMFGINAALNWDTNKIMIYEVCIPFNTFYKASLSPSDSSKVLGISFIVSVTSKNSGGHSGGGDMGGAGGMGGMGGGAGGMHGGGGGGGGGGHGGGHGDGESSTSVESLTAHVKLKLAVKDSPQ